MMNQLKLFAGVITSFFGLMLFLPQAHALDQVVLKSGEIIQGKVLSDVPNRHVDFQYTNGTLRRIPKTEIADVERDIPSVGEDRSLRGSTSEGFWGASMGIMLGLDGIKNDVNYTASTKIGINVSQLGNFAKLAPGITLGYTSSLIELLATLGLRKISNTGLYFTPQFGVGFVSGSSVTSTQFAGGVVLGYEYFLNDHFSVGPDLTYFRLFNPTAGFNSMKFTISLTNHF